MGNCPGNICSVNQQQAARSQNCGTYSCSTQLPVAQYQSGYSEQVNIRQSSIHDVSAYLKQGIKPSSSDRAILTDVNSLLSIAKGINAIEIMPNTAAAGEQSLRAKWDAELVKIENLNTAHYKDSKRLTNDELRLAHENLVTLLGYAYNKNKISFEGLMLAKAEMQAARIQKENNDLKGFCGKLDGNPNYLSQNPEKAIKAYGALLSQASEAAQYIANQEIKSDWEKRIQSRIDLINNFQKNPEEYREKLTQDINFEFAKEEGTLRGIVAWKEKNYDYSIVKADSNSTQDNYYLFKHDETKNLSVSGGICGQDTLSILGDSKYKITVPKGHELTVYTFDPCNERRPDYVVRLSGKTKHIAQSVPLTAHLGVVFANSLTVSAKDKTNNPQNKLLQTPNPRGIGVSPNSSEFIDGVRRPPPPPDNRGTSEELRTDTQTRQNVFEQVYRALSTQSPPTINITPQRTTAKTENSPLVKRINDLNPKLRDLHKLLLCDENGKIVPDRVGKEFRLNPSDYGDLLHKDFKRAGVESAIATSTNNSFILTVTSGIINGKQGVVKYQIKDNDVINSQSVKTLFGEGVESVISNDPFKTRTSSTVDKTKPEAKSPATQPDREFTRYKTIDWSKAKTLPAAGSKEGLKD